MQIPTNFSAAQAVSIASVVSSRDKSSVQSAAAPDNAAVQAQLEKSESANPDRDAQGQGDGLGPHARKKHNEQGVAEPEDSQAVPQISPASDEPPTELDLMC